MPTVTKKYYHNIDLDSNQLINAVIENLATAPTGPVDGQIYYNTVDKKIYYYNISIPQWVEVGASLPANLITGTGTAGQISYWNGTATQAGSANFLWDNTTSTFTATGYKVFQTLAASEPNQYGSELYVTTGWSFTGAEWSGDGTVGFKHATGNTGLLTNLVDIVAEVGATYIISYVITERTAGFATTTFGGTAAALGMNISNSIAIAATTATGLSILPQNTYNGRILFTSIKKVTGGNLASISFFDSTNTLRSEMRYNNSNIFFGKSAGSKTLGFTSVGYGNTGVGDLTLRDNISGNGNTAIGTGNLVSIVSNSMNTAIGYNNMGSFKSLTLGNTYNVAVGSNCMAAATFSGSGNNAVGDSVLQRLTTGSSNSAMGDSAMLFLTTGGLNVGIGRAAGFYNTIGSQNTFVGANAGFVNYAQTDNGVYIGYQALPSANLMTNEIAIGHTTTGNGSNSVTLGNASITKTILRGQIAIGLTSPVASARVQIDSTTQGFLPPRMTTTERNAVASPATGLIIYNTTTLAANVYNGTSWVGMGGDNIYTSNGTLTADRTLTSGGYNLTFTGSNTASSAIARGLNLTHTLVAAANNDVLVGLDINPTFTNGAFTGVSNLAARFYGDVFIKGSGATSASNALTVQNSAGTNSFIVSNGGTVGIGGLPTVGYTLRVYGNIWATGFDQLSVLAGSSGVGSITYYDQGTLSMNLYGSHASEAVKGFFTIKSQDLSYTTPTSVILHADADFLDHPTMIIRSRNTASNSIYFQNYHYSLGALFTTLQPSGGNTDMTFRPNRTNRVIISDSSVAALSVESTTQGFLPPRMTSTQRTAISSPAVGLVVYQTNATEGLYQYLSTGWSAVSSTGYLTINNPTYTGVLKSGTLTYTPSNALATLQTDVVGYNQFVIQNSDNGSFSSSDFVVSNDISDDSTYYGDFGINSSQFSGTGSFALANAIYLYGSDGDLVLGTVTANDVHIVTDSSDVDSITALTTGQILFPHYTANTSFTGTAAGIIGFTTAGALITIDASTIGSGTVTSVELAAGAGISLSGTNPITTSGIITVTNSAPDQVVTITQSGGGLTIEGTYPSFNLINSDKGSSQNIFKNIAVNAQTTITAGSNNETLTVTAGTGVTVGTNNTTKTLTITNSSPDQTVTLTAGTATSITGSYPNFTIGASYTPVNKAGDTMLGYLTLNGDPANPLHAATKQYVDSANSTSIHVHEPVRVETTANLTATYTQGGTTHTVTAIATTDTLTIGAHSLVANDIIVFNSTANGLTAGVPYFVYDAPSGTSIRISELYAGAVKTNLTNGTGLSITSRANSGVGSTLTNAGTQAALIVDGVTLIVGDRVLVNAQTSSFQNGIFVVTNIGSGSTNWILTRSTDSNKYGISTPSSTNEGDYHFVQEGSTNGGKSYVLTTEGVIVFGTTAITFTQFTGSVSYSGGTNIDVNGQTISLTGQVGVANGGTGASTLTGVLIGNGTSAVTSVAGTASQMLRRNSGNSAYEFFTPVYNSRTVTIVSANTTASAAANTDYVYLASGVTTITLPTAVGNTGKYTVKNTGTNTVIINTTSSQTIDGSTSVTIAVRYTALDFISDGSNWNII